MFKKLLIALALFSPFTQASNFTDYSGGSINVNAIMGGDYQVTDVEYVEAELWAGVGGLHFYGFYDINEDGSRFFKLNPKYFVASKLFLNYTQKNFALDNGLESIDHFAGIGYRFGEGDRFWDVSANVRKSDNEIIGLYGWNGFAILTNGVYAIAPTWQVDGWVDYTTYQRDSLTPSKVDYELRGNVGLRKSFPTFHNVYVRIAPHFIKDENDSDIAFHTQVGFTF